MNGEGCAHLDKPASHCVSLQALHSKSDKLKRFPKFHPSSLIWPFLKCALCCARSFETLHLRSNYNLQNSIDWLFSRRWIIKVHTNNIMPNILINHATWSHVKLKCNLSRGTWHDGHPFLRINCAIFSTLSKLLVLILQEKHYSYLRENKHCLKSNNGCGAWRVSGKCFKLNT